ncbi:hypothetical protein AB4Z45_25475 [Paenibacillus sp. MCAF9]|uniref:hypothetical protein n=1 Tax=Paenibacillus sp. MCAF9 TaxID=3233046 RepID=UPI003F96DA89
MMRNTVSTCLLAIGILIIAIGIISGFALSTDEYGDFQIVIALYWWISAIISGFLFIGLAEIVNLLQKLLDKNSGETQSIQSVSSSKHEESVVNDAIAFSNIGEIEGEESETKIKDLTILIDNERVKGEFWITKSNVRIMKKSMFQTDMDAQLVKVITKSNLSSNYVRNKDYIIFSFVEGHNDHKLAFKTHNIYDYERIVKLLK